MKQLLLLVVCAFAFFATGASCKKSVAGSTAENNITHPNPTGSNMKIIIGTRTFTATLYDNTTAAAFKTLLPFTIDMAELNGNEKYADLSRNLNTNASNPGTIREGDLMLYGSSTLVLFYKGFSTSYRYTKLGRIDDPTGLAAAVGAGNVSVTYQLQ